MTFSPALNYSTGLGYLDPHPALPCIFWNFQIFDQKVNFASFITETYSTICLQGQDSCSSCNVSFNDPDLGTGCLSKELNQSLNAFGEICSSVGCTKTIKLSCVALNSFCTFDQTSNTCFIKDISDDFGKEQNNVTECLCKFGYLNRENKCCPSICSSCNFLGVCTGCYSRNSSYSDGQCVCNQGFFSAGDYGNSNNCILCEDGCLNCSADVCYSCSYPNTKPSGKYCICNDKFYGSPSSCKPCPASCSTCSAENNCYTCINSNAEVKNGSCNCKEGLIGDGLICEQCENSCKSCVSFDMCKECKDKIANIVEGICFCPEGFFKDSSFLCQKCGTGCSECADINNCFKCYDKNSIIDGGNCICNDGYYGNLSFENCKSCEPGCSKCDHSECKECIDVNFQPYYNQCVCKTGFYKENDHLCLPCENGCYRCEKLKCLECISPNTLIEGPNCFCKSGFWIDEEKSNQPNCKSCNSDCKTCNSDLKCLTCKTENASPHEKEGCECLTGYWNSSKLNSLNSCQKCKPDCLNCINSLTCLTCKSKNSFLNEEGECKCQAGFFNQSKLENIDSCIPCKSDCETCSSFNECLKCKEGRGELNSTKACVSLCWKNNSTIGKDCLECPELCLRCDVELKCNDCVLNSRKNNGKCKCRKGFLKQNNSCVESFFYGMIEVSEMNKIRITFSDILEKKLTLSDVFLKIDTKKVKFEMSQKMNKVYFINLKEEIKKDQEKNFLLKIKGEVFSVDGKKLFNRTFEGVFKYNSEEVTVFGVKAGQIVKGIAISSIATSLSSNPSSLWSLLNTIQLLIFMPLNSVNYPERLKKTSHSLLEYNPIPNIFVFFIDSNCTSLPYSKALEFGISTSVLMINIGPGLLVLFLSFLYIILLITLEKYLFPSSEKLKKMKQKHQFGLLIRFLIQSYLEIGIFSIIQLKSKIVESGSGHLNMYFSIILIIIVLVSPFMFTYALIYNKTKTNDIDFLLKYETLIEEFEYDRNWKISFYYPLFMIRRLEFVLAQIFLIDFPLIAVGMNIGFSAAFLVFIIYYRPFKDFLAMASNLVGEICVNLVFLCSLFLIFVTEEGRLQRIESFCIYLIFATVTIQLIIGFLNFLATVKKLYLKMEKSRALAFVSIAQQGNSNLKSDEN